jgi:hypothetical protein
MTKFLKRLLVGYCLSTLIAIAVHLRGAAIQGMPPIEVAEDSKGQGMTREDFARDIMRIRDEIYDPIRPVAKEGSFLLKLELAAYASPAILISSAFSPSFLPALTYSEQFRQHHRRRLPLGGTLPESIGATSQAEGMAWGVGQGVAFYLPFLVRRRKKTEDEASGAATDQGRSILDSAIVKCDE